MITTTKGILAGDLELKHLVWERSGKSNRSQVENLITNSRGVFILLSPLSLTGSVNVELEFTLVTVCPDSYLYVVDPGHSYRNGKSDKVATRRRLQLYTFASPLSEKAPSDKVESRWKSAALLCETVMQAPLADRPTREAEGVRFELTRPFGLPVFKTGAINRSATPPEIW